MAKSPDHPELTFVQASGYTKGRPSGPPLWIVVHDMEYPERPSSAEDTAAYFATGAGGRSVSSHYCVDNNSIVQCVRLADTAWTVGNWQGNNRGINWELAGYASQTRAQWLDAYGLAMFALMAPIVQADARKYDIPLVRRTVAELKAFKPGITSHNDLRLAFGETTHTDPGPNFPWDVFLAVMNGGDVSTAEEVWAQKIPSPAAGVASPGWPASDWIKQGYMALKYLNETVVPKLNAQDLVLAEIKEQLDRIEAKLAAGGGGGGVQLPLHMTGTFDGTISG
jgi:hypothetical protein